MFLRRCHSWLALAKLTVVSRFYGESRVLTPTPANTGVQLSSAVLEKYVGRYEFREGSRIVARFMGVTQTVTLVNGHLYLKALPLIPQSETKFESTGAAAEFPVDANGAATRLVLMQAEGNAIYDRQH